MRGLNSFGERIASRDPDRQTAEFHICIAPMNRFNAFCLAEIERVARVTWGKLVPTASSATMLMIHGAGEIEHRLTKTNHP